MYNINAFVLSLPVKIIQLVVNIISRMTEAVMPVLLAILIGTFGVVSYLVWKLSKARNIFRGTAQIAEEQLRTIGKT